MIEDKQLLSELLKLPLPERLKLARLLVDSNVESERSDESRKPLLSLAGRYAGGRGHTSEDCEEILENEADKLTGLSAR